VNNLIKNDVRLLCDVRKNPLSRKFGFSKGNLSILLPKLGIKYMHIPELGIVSKNRKTLAITEDYKVLFRQYTKTLLEKEPYLLQVQNLLKTDSGLP